LEYHLFYRGFGLGEEKWNIRGNGLVSVPRDGYSSTWMTVGFAFAFFFFFTSRDLIQEYWEESSISACLCVA
jgi:hypothetical protein